MFFVKLSFLKSCIIPAGCAIFGACTTYLLTRKSGEIQEEIKDTPKPLPESQEVIPESRGPQTIEEYKRSLQRAQENLKMEQANGAKWMNRANCLDSGIDKQKGVLWWYTDSLLDTIKKGCNQHPKP